VEEAKVLQNEVEVISDSIATSDDGEEDHMGMQL